MPFALSLPWADAVRDPDAALLARYTRDRDSAAFAVLVHRHGPTVFGACVRNAGHRADAEDAFQAVFLLLAERAATLSHPDRLGPWLYGVAVRVARKARRAALRRRTHEAKGAAVPRPEPTGSDWADVAPVLDDELMRLSEHHRAAVLLCDVRGLSRTDAATQLGIPEGTLSSRLNAARKKLAGRLTKRGVTLSVGALATHATAAVPEELAGRLANVLSVFHADGVVPAALASLTPEGVISMKVKLLALAAAVGLGTVGTLTAWPAEDPKPKAEVKQKSDPPKASKPDEPPKEDFGRLPKDKRPKLVEVVNLDLTENVTLPVWVGDGKQLLLIQQFGENSQALREPIRAAGVEVLTGFSTTRFLGTTANGSQWMGFEQKGNGINSYSRLLKFGFADPFKPYQQKRLASVDFNHAMDGRPEAVTPDGKVVFTFGYKTIEERTINSNGKFSFFFRALDATSGEPLRTVAKIDGDERHFSHTFSPARDRLYLLVQKSDGMLIRCVDTSNGKVAWERKFEGLPVREDVYYENRIELSIDGKSLALAIFSVVVTPPPPRTKLLRPGDNRFPSSDPERHTVATIHILDTTNGKDRVELAGQGTGLNTVLALSPDGRLLAGKIFKRRSSNTIAEARGQLAIWDANTGKVLNSWDIGASTKSLVTFAPNRPLMLLWEGGRRQGEPPGTLGFWDLSGLVK